ncbi:hypothetical protein SAMN04487787_12523 [Kosakonia sacchari]|nr:hypothetical protein SAMN04487787_12523 [Kosakonia sacchari]
MIDFESVVTQERTEDAVLFFAGGNEGIGYPQLDRFFSRYKPTVHQTGEFINVINKLKESGAITFDSQMKVKKGPHWKEPDFVKQKKYGIE